jgi:hypothetical protein
MWRSNVNADSTKTKTKGKIVTAKAAAEPQRSVTKIATRYGTVVTIPGVRTQELSTLIVGTAPLIVHSFAQKVRDKILAKHKGEASEGKERKDPIANFNASRYRLRDGSDGIPASGLKAGIVDGFSKAAGVPMTQAKGGIRVHADCMATNLCRLIIPREPEEIAAMDHVPNEIYRVPRCREDVVRNESGVVDIRHRAEYWPWAVLLNVEYLPSVCSELQLLQAIAISGFKVGQCEWRPGSPTSKSGSCGTFRLGFGKEIGLLEKDKLFFDHRWEQPLSMAAE